MAYAPGVSNQPTFPGFTEKIAALSSILREQHLGHVDIAVDGGVNESVLADYRDAGANFFVFGSSGLFLPATDLARQIDAIKLRLGFASAS